MKRVLFALLFCALISGCSHSQSWDQQLVGSWQATQNGVKGFIFVYKADNTFEAYSQTMNFKGQWKIVDRDKRLIKSWMSGYGTITESTAPINEITIDGNAMTERSLKDGLITTLERVPDSPAN